MAAEDLIREGLTQPLAAIAYTVSARLAAAFPHRAILEGDDGGFDLDAYADAGHCVATEKPPLHLQVETSWDEGAIQYHTPNGWFEVEWRGRALDVLLMSWPQGHRVRSNYWILGETIETAREFFSAVCEWCAEVRGEVLVFAGGCWHKDPALFRAIQGATFQNLILAGSLKEEIRRDIESFFSARPLYEEFGVPWKRGVLFIGPPGNGKTHAVKALINSVGRACLYVKSFKNQFTTDHDSIRAVFKRARESTPCLLVFEDLDSLLDGDNRAFFLNELDGFAANTGIITIATTNHPERLDPAILDRPSRFDRKYHFELPARAERAAYLELWNDQLQPAMRLSAAALSGLADGTEGFSFAYLKELVLSSMMRWISAGERDPRDSMEPVMQAQSAALREQMSSVQEEPAVVDEGDTLAYARTLGRRGARMAG